MWNPQTKLLETISAPPGRQQSQPPRIEDPRASQGPRNPQGSQQAKKMEESYGKTIEKSKSKIKNIHEINQNKAS